MFKLCVQHLNELFNFWYCAFINTRYTVLYLVNNKTKLMDMFLLLGTAEQNQLYERQPWQKLVLIFLVELIGTALLMLFGCIGLVPKHPGFEVSEYNGAIGFAGIVAIIIVVSILPNTY